VKTNTSTYTEGYSPSKGEILAIKLSKVLRKEKKRKNTYKLSLFQSEIELISFN